MGLLDDYLNRDQLAAELGVTPRTIMRWQKMPGGLPHIQMVGRALYRITSVRAWLESRERAPDEGT